MKVAKQQQPIGIYPFPQNLAFRENNPKRAKQIGR